MACCGKKTRYVRRAQGTPKPVKVKTPSNTKQVYESKNPPCKRCGGSTRVYQQYNLNGKLHVSYMCNSCRAVKLEKL
jgi:tRNA(Ile2) C34 agmatinyltransferase TiaS